MNRCGCNAGQERHNVDAALIGECLGCGATFSAWDGDWRLAGALRMCGEAYAMLEELITWHYDHHHCGCGPCRALIEKARQCVHEYGVYDDALPWRKPVDVVTP